MDISIVGPGQLLTAVRSVVAESEQSLLCVAFANEAGIRLLEPALKNGPDRVRLLSTTVFGDTTAAALGHAAALGVQVRTLNLPRGTYHPKVYIGARADRISALVGSANLTSGLLRNIEAAAVLAGNNHEASLIDLQELAESWWTHPAATPWVGNVEVPLHDNFVADLWGHLQRSVHPGMTVLTLSDARPNRVMEVGPTALWVETERSRGQRRGAQEVPAWMFNIAWDYLASHGSLSNTTLLNDLNVHRSSVVCAVLALLAPVEVVSRRPIVLALKPASATFEAADAAARYGTASPAQPPQPPFRVHASSEVVEAWSTDRLPFDPKGWRREFRDGLRDALVNLEVRDDDLLHAVYSSADQSFCDVENVLLYNVGMAAFAGHMRSGLQVERRFAVPAAAQRQGDAHHHRYAAVAANNGLTHWTRSGVLAMWSDVRWPTRPLKAADWWYALRRADVKVFGRLDPKAFFGVDIVLSGPPSLPSGLHNVLKPMLDGVIAALQRHDGSNLDTVATRLAEELDAEPERVFNLLTTDAVDVVGESQLVRPYRAGLQWNPADDRCVAVRLRRVAKGDDVKVQGELFTVERRAEVSA